MQLAQSAGQSLSHCLEALAALHASNLKASLDVTSGTVQASHDVTSGTVQALTDLDVARELSQAEVRHLREGLQQQLEEARTLATESKQAAAAAAVSVGQWRNRWGGLSCSRDGAIYKSKRHVVVLQDSSTQARGVVQ